MGMGFTISLVNELTPGLIQPMPGYGCFELAMITMPQLRFGKALTLDQINNVHRIASAIPSVVGNNCLMGPQHTELARIAAEQIGQTYHIRRVGIDCRDNRGMMFEPDVILTGCYNFDYVVIWHSVIISGQETPNGHYILGDSHSRWIYNANPTLTLGALKAVIAYREV
jgi:hypothetical protein